MSRKSYNKSVGIPQTGVLYEKFNEKTEYKSNLKVKKLSFQGMAPLTPFFWLGNHKSNMSEKYIPETS